MPISTAPTLQGKTGRFTLASVAGIDRQLAKLRRQRLRCWAPDAEEHGYNVRLGYAYGEDIDLMLDARNALTRDQQQPGTELRKRRTATRQ